MTRNYISGPPAQRFWAKVDGGDYRACWTWQAATSSGYGIFQQGPGRRVYAHRWAYEDLIGEIPPGLELDHLCRNTWCVNPWHLEPVTTAVNTGRGTRANKTHCVQGHLLAGDNLYIQISGKYQHRVCRACRRLSVGKFRQKQRESQP